MRMVQEFYRAYLNKEHAARKQLLYVMNPNKFMACQFLVEYHERVQFTCLHEKPSKKLMIHDSLFIAELLCED